MDTVRRGVSNHGLAEEGTGDRDKWKNLVLGGGNLLYSGQTEVRNVTDILDFVNNIRLKEHPPPLHVSEN